MSPARLVRLFVRHRNAANLLMILALVMGGVALARLNTQFFPNIGFDVIQISVEWPGASAEDIEDGIIRAIEPEVRFLDGIRTLRSTARESFGSVTMEFEPGSDMQAALSDAESAVSRITTLPAESEEPEISRFVLYETVSRLSISGPFPEARLKEIAEEIRDDLLDRGIDRISMFGARDEEIWIEVDADTLMSLDMTLDDVASAVRAQSRDVPLGTLDGDFERQIRTLGRRLDADTLGEVTIRTFDSGEKIYLVDIAEVSDRHDRTQPVADRDGHPAIELEISRAIMADALEAAATVDGYLAERAGTWPAGLAVQQFDKAADLIDERIQLLIKNGLGGLALVLVVLFVFLNARVAFWIACGIPISLMATVVVMLATGQSINMLSLFGMIMALGIIVDDAIVVGEHAAFRHSQGLTAAQAAESGALRMLAPVTAASITTIAAFLPILMIGGIIGQIISAIPIAVVAILVASLIECFLILPSHMRDALQTNRPPGAWRRYFDAAFDRFRDGAFRRFVSAIVAWRYLTLATALAVLVVSTGLIAGGRVGFLFFSSPESEVVLAEAAFAPGTPRETTHAMLHQMEEALVRAEQRFGEDSEGLVRIALARVGVGSSEQANETGDHVGSMQVELPPSDSRNVRTAAFIEAWRDEIEPMPGLERLIVRERIGGPPGRDLDVRLTAGTLDDLKAAALDVRELLDRYPGVSDIADSLPYGRPELILDLTPRGRALGFTTEAVARQVRNAFEGAIADRFARDDDEVTVRVRLRDDDRSAAGLRGLRLRTPGGGEVALVDVVDIREQRGFSVIRREDGVREVSVTAEVDNAVADANAIVADLPSAGLSAIADRYGVEFRFAGKAEEQQETFADMRIGGIIALSSIYIVLAWVFASYGRPLVVMAIIPFGLIGAIFGHMLLGYDLTILSMVSLLGLSGILVNDSIILVSTIDHHLRQDGKSVRDAVIDGTCERLRAVLLTSLTTIGGLTPLLFETSLQAQFLIPMAITLVFGLMGTTFLVLLVVPALLAIQEDIRSLPRRLLRRAERGAAAAE